MNINKQREKRHAQINNNYNILISVTNYIKNAYKEVNHKLATFEKFNQHT